MQIKTDFTKTKLYNIHHVYIEHEGKMYHGMCKWQNRTWERFSYETALLNTLFQMDEETYLKAREIVKGVNYLTDAIKGLEWL